MVCAMKLLCKRDGTPNALLVVRGDGNLLFHFILSKIVARGAKKYTFTTNKAYTLHSFRLRLGQEKDALAFVDLNLLS